MTDATELAALESNLRKAVEDYDKAERWESEARKSVCAAKNNLNAAQRQLDEYVAKLRNAAPRDSDWGQKRIRPIRQEAA